MPSLEQEAYEKSQQVEGELRARILKLGRALEATTGAIVGTTKGHRPNPEEREVWQRE